jgi:Predicted ATPases
MLIDFTFENYLSFKDKATISLVVPGWKEPEHTRYVLEVERGKYALSPFAAIYGQNAAGKSNVIKALMDFVNLVLYSHTLGIDAPIPSYKPYKLDISRQSAPILFETEFIAEGIRYLLNVIFGSELHSARRARILSARQKSAALFKKKRRINTFWDRFQRYKERA